MSNQTINFFRKNNIDPSIMGSINYEETRLAIREIGVLKLRLLGLTQAKIGEKYGVSGNRIFQLESKAIRILKMYLYRKLGTWYEL